MKEVESMETSTKTMGPISGEPAPAASSGRRFAAMAWGS